MSCHMAASKTWNIFTLIETALFQRQSYGMDRDVVCQLPLSSHACDAFTQTLLMAAFWVSTGLHVEGQKAGI